LKRTREFHEDEGGILLFSTNKDAPVVDFYITHYNLVDRINKNFYSVVDCNYHCSWKKLLFFALLMTLVMNAWAAYQEWKITTRVDKRKGSRAGIESIHNQSLVNFILNVCEQLGKSQ
jgi:hypothetical protein